MDKEFFKELLAELEDDGFSSEPFFTVETYDDDYDYIDCSTYMKEYCESEFLHLFTANFHIAINPEKDFIKVFHMFSFNTSEFGVPPEYCRNEIYDDDNSQLSVSTNGFSQNHTHCTYETEEEKFQLSCTDMGYFITVIDKLWDNINLHIDEDEK